jgi:hypothetical protein
MFDKAANYFRDSKQENDPNFNFDRSLSIFFKCQNYLALTEEKLGELNEAKKRFEALITLVEANRGKNSPSLIEYLENYARVLRSKKQIVLAMNVEKRIELLKNPKR